MDASRNYHKWSKSGREKQIPYDITYIWNLKYGTDELIYKTEIDIEVRLMTTSGERVKGGKDREFGISRCKLLYIERISNKILQYSTENCI